MHKTIVILAAVMVLAAPSVRATLVGSWDFNEGSGQFAADQSGFGNTATLGNNSVDTVADPTWVAGRPVYGGTALNYDNTDDFARVLDPGASSLDIGGVGDSDAMTIAAWINLANLADHNTIVSKSTGNGPGNYEFNINPGTGTLLLLSLNEGGTASFPTSNGPGVPTAVWTHVAAVLQETGPASFDVTYYINGTQNGTTVTTPNSFGFPNNQPLWIGNRGDGVTVFNGAIDNVMIWNEALTAAQVAAVFIPEPSTALLLALGGGLIVRRRRCHAARGV